VQPTRQQQFQPANSDVPQEGDIKPPYNHKPARATQRWPLQFAPWITLRRILRL
jgi:hypothetical protein